MAPKSERPALAARRGRRAAQAIFTLMAAAFITISTVEIGRQVFGYSTTYPEVSAPCGFALKFFEDELERGEARALREKTAAQSASLFDSSLQMSVDTVIKQCSAPGDEAAVVAAKRLREASVSQIDGDYANLARLRRAIDMRIGR